MRTAERKLEPWFEDLRDEFNEALPGIIDGKPDRADLMVSRSRARNAHITMQEIMIAVAYEADVPMAGFTGERKSARISKARTLACLLASDLRPDLSTMQIAHRFKRDKSTINYALRRARHLMDTDADFGHCYERVRRRLGLRMTPEDWRTCAAWRS